MAKLEEISLAELHKLLEEVDEKKSTQRLMLAIPYKQGPGCADDCRTVRHARAYHPRVV